jgi:hypothetical protein
MSLLQTIGNLKWMAENEPKIREVLPETWTHIDNLNALRIGFRLKLIGVDWRSPEEFGQAMVFIEHAGIMQRQNDYQVRRNPRTVYAELQ